METLAKDGIQDASIETLDAGELKKQVNRFFQNGAIGCRRRCSTLIP